MHNSTFVRRRKSPGGLECEIYRLSLRDLSVFHPLAKRFAFEQLRDDIGRGFIRADVVNRKDIRMIEHADGSRLLLETAEPVGVACDSGGQQFDGDLAPK